MKPGDIAYMKRVELQDREPVLLIESWHDSGSGKVFWEILVNDEVELVLEEELEIYNEAR
tara:strand:+ start:159 stop:338 length:180 start_codon:yes stop_codon:yes gene_type:complete